MVRAVGVKGAGAMRRWVRRLHLWLGLGLGLLFAVIGLTGSALVFYTGIDAVLHPEDNNYLYFCAKEDFSGYHAFATNKEDHLLNARRYQAALTRNGIQ